MAILQTCTCGKTFCTSVGGSWQCDDCNGENARKKAEADRWAALPLEEKVEELKRRLDASEQRQSWDGRIG
jgi:hypothetical protein